MAIQTAANNQITVLSASWNDGSTTYTALKLDVNNTLTPPGSLLLDIGTNTGTYSSKLLINVSGSVGIGTATPGAILHTLTTGNTTGIFATSAATGWLELRRSTSTTLGYIGTGGGLVTGAADADLAFRCESGNILFSSVAAELARIDSSGNVGIGTSSFTGRLYVSGSSTGTTPSLLVRHGVAAGSSLPVLDVQNSSGTSLLFVSGSGFVGVGTNTTSGGAIFQVSSSLAGNANSVLIIGTQFFGTSINLYKGQTQVFQLANGTETMRITSTGNVGIGNNSPSARLFISGSSSASTSTMIVRAGTSDQTGPVLQVENNIGTTLMVVSGSGRVGIGTNLIFSDLMLIQGSTSDSSEGALRVQNSTANPIIYARNDQRVAIGTTSVTTGRSLTTVADIDVYGLRIGRGSSTDVSNTAVGNNVMSSATTSTENTAVGYLAMRDVTSAQGNTAIGAYALLACTDGGGNTAVGDLSMFSVDSGFNNTAVGYLTATGITTGSENTSVGASAGSGGSFNTAIGSGAGAGSGNGNTTLGRYAGVLLSNGQRNVAVGLDAGSTTNAGNDNIFIGAGSRALSAVNSNSIVIGSGSVGIGTNTMVLGNSSTATTFIAGNVGIGTTSFTARLFVSGSSTASTSTMIVRAGSASQTGGVEVFDVQNSAGTSLFNVSGSGFVGVGTTDRQTSESTREILSIYGQPPVNSFQGQLLVSIGSTSQFDIDAGAQINFQSADVNNFRQSGYIKSAKETVAPTNYGMYMSFGTRADGVASISERMRIDSTGSIGVGTTVAPARFFVSGSSSTSQSSMIVRAGTPNQIGGTKILQVLKNDGTGIFHVSGSGDVFVDNGNLVIGTSGKGIDFSATSNAPSGTLGQELLDDYEEGTFTPGLTVGGGGSITSTRAGYYTKIGRVVHVKFFVQATAVSGARTTLLITGLPFQIDVTYTNAWIECYGLSNTGGLTDDFAHGCVWSNATSNLLNFDIYETTSGFPIASPASFIAVDTILAGHVTYFTNQ